MKKETKKYIKFVGRDKEKVESIYKYMFKRVKEALSFSSLYYIEEFYTEKLELPRHLITKDVEVITVDEMGRYGLTSNIYIDNFLYKDLSSNNLEFILYEKDMGKIELAYKFLKEESSIEVVNALSEIRGTNLFNSIVNEVTTQSPHYRYENNEDIISLSDYYYAGKDLDVHTFLALFSF